MLNYEIATFSAWILDLNAYKSHINKCTSQKNAFLMMNSVFMVCTCVLLFRLLLIYKRYSVTFIGHVALYVSAPVTSA